MSSSTPYQGNDDMRQDAVMEQVFNVANQLLSKNQLTQHLSMRTYKVCDDYYHNLCSNESRNIANVWCNLYRILSVLIKMNNDSY